MTRQQLRNQIGEQLIRDAQYMAELRRQAEVYGAHKLTFEEQRILRIDAKRRAPVVRRQGRA